MNDISPRPRGHRDEAKAGGGVEVIPHHSVPTLSVVLITDCGFPCRLIYCTIMPAASPEYDDYKYHVSTS